MFCGAGGTSTGLALACEEIGLNVHLTAINHWDIAVSSHEKNHPWATHLCQRVEATDPTKIVPSGMLDLLVASPECTHHSIARGGKPIQDQKRASPWYILPWLSRIYTKAVLIENVPEFRTWGPLGANGRPLKSKKGETFRAFIHAIRAQGYSVSYRVLNAADYGDATSRKRLFIIAKRGNNLLKWPQQTHSKNGKVKGTLKWRSAREIIDWSLEGKSIFNRKKPLAPATMKRIMAGLEKYGSPELKPFLVIMHGTNEHSIRSSAKSLDEPVPSLTTTGHVAVVEPFVLGQQSCSAPRTVEEPLPTISTSGAISKIDAFILPPLGYYHHDGKSNPPRDLDDPLQTITQRGGGHLVSAHIQSHFGERTGQKPRTISIDDPLPTITSREPALVEGILYNYHGKNTSYCSIDSPAPCFGTKQQVALIQPVLNGWKLDIKFRMLQPHELAGAMGFENYEFTGNKQQIVRQIGNAVAVNMAKALCSSLINKK